MNNRRARRHWNALLLKVKPYAAELTAWAATLPKAPTDPIVAARLYEKRTGKKPPVPYDILPNFLRGPKDREREARERQEAADAYVDELIEKNRGSVIEPPKDENR